MLAQRLLESSSIESERALESLPVAGAAEVVGWGRSALFLDEFIKALCAGLFTAALEQKGAPVAHRDADDG